MKTIIAMLIFAVGTACWAAPLTGTDRNADIRKSYERSRLQSEMNRLDAESNRLRGSSRPSDRQDLQRYESESRSIQEKLNKTR